MSNLKKQIKSVLRFSEKKALNSACSMNEREYILDYFGFEPGMSSIA